MCSASCCLGDGREILLLLDEEPLCRRVTRESEVLPLHLAESGFDGDETVRIERQQDVVTLRWRRHWLVRGGLRREFTRRVCGYNRRAGRASPMR